MQFLFMYSKTDAKHLCGEKEFNIIWGLFLGPVLYDGLWSEDEQNLTKVIK